MKANLLPAHNQVQDVLDSDAVKVPCGVVCTLQSHLEHAGSLACSALLCPALPCPERDRCTPQTVGNMEIGVSLTLVWREGEKHKYFPGGLFSGVCVCVCVCVRSFILKGLVKYMSVSRLCHIL